MVESYKSEEEVEIIVIHSNSLIHSIKLYQAL